MQMLHICLQILFQRCLELAKMGSVTEAAVKATTCLPEPRKRGLAHLRDHSNEGKSVIFQTLRADTDGAPSMNNLGMSLLVLSHQL